MRELKEANGDVLCLQEVQADHYEKYVKPSLLEAGFDGIYKQKTRDSMGIPGKVCTCVFISLNMNMLFERASERGPLIFQICF
jgi:mRNA deadenylase 3'-5' endonuclease subunit Ccr4